jgi:hypothetical protein
MLPRHCYDKPPDRTAILDVMISALQLVIGLNMTQVM